MVLLGEIMRNISENKKAVPRKRHGFFITVGY